MTTQEIKRGCKMKAETAIIKYQEVKSMHTKIGSPQENIIVTHEAVVVLFEDGSFKVIKHDYEEPTK